MLSSVVLPILTVSQLQCPDPTQYRDLNSWSCSSQCPDLTLPVELVRTDFTNSYFRYCRGILSRLDIELGTKSNPFRMLDDPFREAFNNFPDQNPSIIVNVKSGAATTLHGKQMPLILFSTDIIIRPYSENLNVDQSTIYSNINLYQNGYSRNFSLFNPTIDQSNQIISYNYQKWIDKGITQSKMISDVKYKFYSWDSSMTFLNIIFTEITGEVIQQNALITGGNTLFKTLTIRNCQFFLQMPMFFTQQGWLQTIENNFINITAWQSLSTTNIASTDCSHNNPSIANNQYWNNNTFVGTNKLRQSMIAFGQQHNLRKTGNTGMNVTFEDNYFDGLANRLEMPLIQIRGDHVTIRNITIKNGQIIYIQLFSVLSNAIQMTGSLVTSATNYALLSLESSNNMDIKDLIIMSSSLGYNMAIGMTQSNYNNGNKVSIEFTNITLINNTISGTSSMFYVDQIIYNNLIISLNVCKFINNTLDKGSYFALNNNAKEISINHCIIHNNKGFFAEMQPVDVQDETNQQNLIVQNTYFKNHYGFTQGLFHVTSNCQLLIRNASFNNCYSLGRGSIVFAEKKQSSTKIYDSNFTKNYAYQGGLFFSQLDTIIESHNCQFIDNFGVIGGVLYLQNDGQANFYNSILSNNLALKSGLFQVYNSQNPLIVSGGLISQNGIQYSQMLNEIQNYQFIDTQASTLKLKANYPIIRQQSYSTSEINYLSASNIKGSVFSTKNSDLIIRNSIIKDLNHNSEQYSIINIQNTDTVINNLTIQNITSEKTQKNPIIQIKESSCTLTSLNSIQFSAQLLNLQNSEIEINNSLFQDGHNDIIDGITIYSYSTNLKITDSIFQNLSSSIGSAIYDTHILEAGTIKSLEIYNSQLLNNSAGEMGGSIFGQDIDFTIHNSIIKDNKAMLSGGFSYLSCSLDNSKGCTYDIQKNVFTRNQALKRGGSIYYDLYSPFNLETNLFENNTSPYGPNIASFPYNLKIINSELLWSKSLVSGGILEQAMLVGIFDQNNQLITTDNVSTCSVQTEDLALQISGNTKVLAKNGVYNFTQIQILAKPDYNSKLKFTSTAINNVLLQTIKPNITTLVELEMNAQLVIRENYVRYVPLKLKIKFMPDQEQLNVQNAYLQGSLLKSAKRNKPQTVLIRILTNYFQVVMLVKDFDLHWPPQVQQVLNYFSYVSSSQERLFSFDCMYYQLGLKNQSSFYIKVIMFGLMPIFFSLLGALFWVIVRFTCKRGPNNSFDLSQNILVTSFVFIFILYPQITSISFGLFNCINYEDGTSYLKRDMTIQCWEGEHLKMALAIGLPFIFIWAIGFPAIVLWRLNKAKNYLGKEFNLQRYGLFYVGLNDESFYWELVIVNLRKLIFIICGSILSTYKQEYKALIGVAVATLFGGLFFLEQDVQNNENFLTGLFLAILFYNTFFVATWAYKFSTVLIRLHQRTIKKIHCLKFLQVESYENNLLQESEKLRSKKSSYLKAKDTNTSNLGLIESYSLGKYIDEKTKIEKNTANHLQESSISQHTQNKKTANDVTPVTNPQQTIVSMAGIINSQVFQPNSQRSSDQSTRRQLIKNETPFEQLGNNMKKPNFNNEDYIAVGTSQDLSNISEERKNKRKSKQKRKPPKEI
ncbi:UNKNOWN [Stylonychia lemnae]|uniref:Right handed beta helix domain-containing protein n=1 Tax=Stylonychia lemnae TaxID=5949 RepID=A0A078A1L3_STYLE|nr:UNKNOWN [Stylonychia lemnae]|eukprot:CDW75737.1 UNKNOWN [Stylonychia lemnae]